MTEEINTLIWWVEQNYATKPGEDDEHVGQLIREVQELRAVNRGYVAAQMAEVQHRARATGALLTPELESNIRRDEREQCALVAENEPTNGAGEYAEGWDDAAGTIATRIRENR